MILIRDGATCCNCSAAVLLPTTSLLLTLNPLESRSLSAVFFLCSLRFREVAWSPLCLCAQKCRRPRRPTNRKQERRGLREHKEVWSYGLVSG